MFRKKSRRTGWHPQARYYMVEFHYPSQAGRGVQFKKRRTVELAVLHLDTCRNSACSLPPSGFMKRYNFPSRRTHRLSQLPSLRTYFFIEMGTEDNLPLCKRQSSCSATLTLIAPSQYLYFYPHKLWATGSLGGRSAVTGP